MTGAYLRVNRNNKWQNIEVEHLTDVEREELLTKDPRLIHWLHMTCHKLVELETLINSLIEDEILEEV